MTHVNTGFNRGTQVQEEKSQSARRFKNTKVMTGDLTEQPSRAVAAKD